MAQQEDVVARMLAGKVEMGVAVVLVALTMVVEGSVGLLALALLELLCLSWPSSLHLRLFVVANHLQAHVGLHVEQVEWRLLVPIRRWRTV